MSFSRAARDNFQRRYPCSCRARNSFFGCSKLEAIQNRKTGHCKFSFLTIRYYNKFLFPRPFELGMPRKHVYFTLLLRFGRAFKDERIKVRFLHGVLKDVLMCTTSSSWMMIQSGPLWLPNVSESQTVVWNFAQLHTKLPKPSPASTQPDMLFHRRHVPQVGKWLVLGYHNNTTSHSLHHVPEFPGNDASLVVAYKHAEFVLYMQEGSISRKHPLWPPGEARSNPAHDPKLFEDNCQLIFLEG